MKETPKQPVVKYSEVFSEFIKPLLSDSETEKSFIKKAQAGMAIWNYCVYFENNIQGTEIMEIALKDSWANHPEYKLSIMALIQRKQDFFAKYAQVIVDVKINTKPDGSKTFYVESAPAHVLPKSS